MSQICGVGGWWGPLFYGSLPLPTFFFAGFALCRYGMNFTFSSPFFFRSNQDKLDIVMTTLFIGVGNWYADMNFTFAFCFSYKTMIPTDWTLSGQLYGEPISLLQCGTIILSTMVPQPPTSNSIFTHLEIIEALVKEKKLSNSDYCNWRQPTQVMQPNPTHHNWCSGQNQLK